MSKNNIKLKILFKYYSKNTIIKVIINVPFISNIKYKIQKCRNILKKALYVVLPSAGAKVGLVLNRSPRGR